MCVKVFVRGCGRGVGVRDVVVLVRERVGERDGEVLFTAE